MNNFIRIGNGALKGESDYFETTSGVSKSFQQLYGLYHAFIQPSSKENGSGVSFRFRIKDQVRSR